MECPILNMSVKFFDGSRARVWNMQQSDLKKPVQVDKELKNVKREPKIST